MVVNERYKGYVIFKDNEGYLFAEREDTLPRVIYGKHDIEELKRKIDKVVVVPKEKCKKVEDMYRCSLGTIIELLISGDKVLYDAPRLKGEEKWSRIRELINNFPNGLELGSEDIPSINVPMLEGTRFLVFRKDKLDSLIEELKELVKGE